jgi:hypothetical protein
VTYTRTDGNRPTITKDLAKSFKENLIPDNSPIPAVNFFTASPAGSSGFVCGGKHEPACNSADDTVTGTITVDLSFEELGGPKDKTVEATGSLVETGTYIADYAGIISSPNCTSSTGKETD